MTPEEITDFIVKHRWRVARTMPEMPHAYVVKAQCRDAAEFERFVMHIRRHGYTQRFGKREFVYFDWPVDGAIHQFWTMGAPLSETIIINRAVKA
jgi:hypothetical protein